MSYQDFVALALHADRLLVRQAVSVALGTQAALSDNELGPEWGDAIASGAAALALLDSANDARFAARRRRRGSAGHLGGLG